MSDAAPSTKYEWLVMLFLAGDNDIFRFGNILLEEAKRVGSTDTVAIVAEQDPVKPQEPTRRGQILNGVWNSEDIGVTAGDPQTIIEFVQWAHQRFPAEKRLLVLWDHGNGWQNVHVFGPVTRATAERRLENILEVIEAVDQQPGIGVLCFDSCLMAMIEIAYELEGRVEYIVASENIVPADTGWPYVSILGALNQRPQISPAEIAVAIVDGFSGSYNDSEQQPVTLSALKVKNVNDAVKAIDALSRELLATCVNGGRDKVVFARRYAQSFGNPDYVDIVSFCDELVLQEISPEINAAANDVRDKVRAVVLAPVHGSTLSVSHAHGLSIYFPDRPMSKLYQNLRFAQPANCMWSTFIAMMAPHFSAETLMEKRPHGKKSGGHGKHQGQRAKKGNLPVAPSVTETPGHDHYGPH